MFTSDRWVEHEKTFGGLLAVFEAFDELFASSEYTFGKLFG